NKIVILGSDYRKYHHTFFDTSFLWNIPFEQLQCFSVDYIICVGKFCYDLEIRLKHAKIPESQIILCPKESRLLAHLLKVPKSHIFSYCYQPKETEEQL